MHDDPVFDGLSLVVIERPTIIPRIAVDSMCSEIHGKEDKEVGFEHGLELYEGVPKQWRAGNWWVPLKGHNDVLQGIAILVTF